MAVVVAAAAAAAIAGAYVFWFRDLDGGPANAVYTVRRGPLTINISLDGEIRSRDPAVVKCEVEGLTTILKIVDEGAEVQAGDLLVTLDSSQLEQTKTQQQLKVNNAEAAFVKAREDLAVIKSQGESDVADAELAYRFAQLDLEKYVRGEYPDKLQKAEADITLAKEDLERAKDTLEWSRKLTAEGYLNASEFQDDELAVRKKELDLQMAESALHLLQDYTHQRDLEQFQTNVEQTGRALERARRKAAANDLQAQADLQAKQSELEQEKTTLGKITTQLEKCVITAPVSGRVVYATSVSGRWGGETPIEEGREVREMEPIIYLPTSTSMMTVIYVPESSLKKVAVDMPVHVTVDALPGQVFAGTIHTISAIPDRYRSFLNPGLKEYEAEIYVDDKGADLRNGMNCRIDIIVAHYEDALYVPVQCAVRVGEEPVVYLQTPQGVQRRSVKTGLDNNRMVHILGGLEEGEQVLLAPPLEEATKPDTGGELPALAPTTRPTAGAGEDSAVPSAEGATAEPTSQPNVEPTRQPTTRPAQGQWDGGSGRPGRPPGGGHRRPGSGGL